MAEKLHRYRGILDGCNHRFGTFQTEWYLVSDVDYRRTQILRDKDEEIERLKESMAKHFHTEHLSGDGPEIDRWKAKCREAEASLEKEIESSEFWRVRYEDEVKRLKRMTGPEPLTDFYEQVNRADAAEGKLKKAIHELWRHQNNAQTNEVLADIESPRYIGMDIGTEPAFTVPLHGASEGNPFERGSLLDKANAKILAAVDEAEERMHQPDPREGE